jgi:hypothetical protein
MNKYEAKQEARREGYKAKAKKERERADKLLTEGVEMFRQIPGGQPIHIGHHSEASDRAYRERAHNKIGRSLEILEKAKQLEEKADSVGHGGISSDDQDAIKKLTQKLEERQEEHERMKKANAEARRNNTRQPFTRCELSTSNASINRVKKRIESLQRAKKALNPIIRDTWEFRDSVEDNRYMFIFPGKPETHIRTELKKNAFKWSPTRSAWVRKKSPNARRAARNVAIYLRDNCG